MSKQPTKRPPIEVLQQHLADKLTRNHVGELHQVHRHTVRNWYLHYGMQPPTIGKSPDIGPVDIEVDGAKVCALPIGKDGVDRYILPGGYIVTGTEDGRRMGVIMNVLMSKRIEQ